MSKPVYFWSAKTDTGYLSQWYKAPFVQEDGIKFDYMETYMMYHKAKLFGDDITALQIRQCNDPRMIKSLGRQVKGFDESTWKKKREQIVYKGNLMKFTQNDEIKQKLLATEDRLLVEASKFDKIWGIGFAEGDAEKYRDQWGLNKLGKQLVKVRTTIRNREA